jgi:molecular chaperone DnaJ
VRVHVTPHAVFGRSGNDLTIKVPVTFAELALGTTLDVPTLDSKVTLRVPPGTASGRVLRVRGKGIVRKDGQAGDLLVTLQVSVPANMDSSAKSALESYAQATATHDPRPELTRMLDQRRDS